jgi:transposase InsO family protein
MIIVTKIDDQWSADLMDMVKFNKYNRGVAFVLVVIDVFSKYLWLRPLKDKKWATVAKPLEDIILEGSTPRRFRTDRGQEFKAKEDRALLNRKNVQQLLTNNET